MSTLIVICNSNTKEYFFTTDHCQNHNLGDYFVPVTMGLPLFVVKRESCPDGWVKNKEDYKKVFQYDGKEIPNPDPKFQA